MKNNFTRNDIKAGMLVFVKDYDSGEIYMSQIYDTKYGLCVSTESHWFPLSVLSVEDLSDNYKEIVEVWDICLNTSGAYKINTTDRKILWKRRKPVKLTVAQIEKILGYEIEVVDENE
jgi:hypothetical protein